MEWAPVSSADPRQPQSFHQVLRYSLILVNTDFVVVRTKIATVFRKEELEPGRILAARCVLEVEGDQILQEPHVT